MSEPRTIRILLLEDNQADAKLVSRMLVHGGVDSELSLARSESEFKSLIKAKTFDILLGDYRLPSWTGIDALRWARQEGLNTPFILVSGTIGDELAVECIKQGAIDYVLKDHLDRLPLAIQRAIQEAKLFSERDRAEKELRESEKHYRSIISHAPYGIYKVDAMGNILMANPAMISMLGYESEAEVLVLKSYKDVYANPGDRAAIMPRWESGEEVKGFQTKFKRKDGSLITVRLAGRRTSEERHPLSTFEIFVENITDRLVLEEQFQRAQRMEAIGRFAGGIAHDFNNLLMVINSSAELIGSTKDPERVKKFLEMIKSAVHKAAGMTRRLLAFSRQQVLQPVVLSVNDVATDLCKMLPQLLGEDIELVLDLEPTLENVNADRGQLEQVLMNLAVNARDAMPSGGKLTIETRNVELDNSYPVRHGVQIAPGQYVVLAVTDSGTGMDSETQARIFEPFFTTKEPGKGTGLGLASVYGIVKQSGGFIWVYSEVGKGSTFKVYLQAVSSKAETRHEQKIDIASGGSETILLVEDETMLRTMMADYLHAKGYTVLESENGKEALEKFKTTPEKIDILITDVVMPGLGGPALAEALMPLRPKMRVIYISGYADRGSDQTMSPGKFAYLQKPFNLEILAQKIRSIMTAENV